MSNPKPEPPSHEIILCHTPEERQHCIDVVSPPMLYPSNIGGPM